MGQLNFKINDFVGIYIRHAIRRGPGIEYQPTVSYASVHLHVISDVGTVRDTSQFWIPWHRASGLQRPEAFGMEPFRHLTIA